MTAGASWDVDLNAALTPDGRDWQPFRDGIQVSWIYRSEDGGSSAAFLRYAPGATVPRHRHAGYEHILILAGSQTDDNGVHGAGTMMVSPPGTGHAVASEDGCVVLAVWEKPVEFV